MGEDFYIFPFQAARDSDQQEGSRDGSTMYNHFPRPKSLRCLLKNTKSKVISTKFEKAIQILRFDAFPLFCSGDINSNDLNNDSISQRPSSARLANSQDLTKTVMIDKNDIEELEALVQDTNTDTSSKYHDAESEFMSCSDDVYIIYYLLTFYTFKFTNIHKKPTL